MTILYCSYRDLPSPLKIYVMAVHLEKSISPFHFSNKGRTFLDGEDIYSMINGSFQL